MVKPIKTETTAIDANMAVMMPIFLSSVNL